MHFKDIKPFTRSSSYTVDIGWGFLEEWLEHAKKDCEDLQLDPEFQRHHVWDDNKRSRYIEYILRGGRSSMDIYFNCANYVGNGKEGPMQLVDGKQRLDAVRRYLRSEVPAFNIYFKDMKGSLRMTGPRFRVHINDLQTQVEVLQWYLDLNEGGVAHTKDELNRVRAMLLEESSGS